MRRIFVTMLCAGLVSVTFVARPFQGRVFAQGDGGYRLVPNWPKLPPGMYFGLKDAPPPPAEREAQAAARRARGGSARFARCHGRADESAGHLRPRDRR